MPDAQELFKALAHESPRGQLLLIAISCEAGLSDLIAATTVSADLAAPLIDQRSSFGALLSIARAFGLLPTNVGDALHEINRLRNMIAHTSLGIGDPFEIDTVRDTVLRLPFRLELAPTKTPKEVREIFLHASLEALAHLSVAIKTARRRRPKAPSPEVLNLLHKNRKEILRVVVETLKSELPAEE